MGSCFFSKITKNVLVKVMVAACIAVIGFTQTAQAQGPWNCGAASNAGGAASVVATLSAGTLTISGTGAMADYDGYSTVAPWNNSNFTSVIIENGVTSIGNMAFRSSGLTSLTIGNSVDKIGLGAFRYCSDLTSLTIPGSVTSIDYYAFEGCSGLTSLTIPNTVTFINYMAFQYCSGLTQITIGSGLASLDGFYFDTYSKLTEITVAADNANYSSDNGVLFNKEKKTLIAYPAAKTGTTYAIPNGVTTIGNMAFRGCIGLTSITIPNTVTDIRTSAFESCSKLTSVTIPNSVTTIGSFAFEECTGLKQIINRKESPQTIDEYVFYHITVSDVKLFVPASAVAAYKAADTWKDFESVEAFDIVPPTTASGLVYTGIEQSAGIAENANYKITGDTKATNAGTHTAKVVLIDKSIYEWEDGSTDDLTLTWSIEKATGVFGTPAAASATYSPSLKLSDLNLPAGYVFNAPTTALSVANSGQSFAATFTNPNGNFNAATGNIVVNVAKAAGATVLTPALASKTHNSITINAIVAASGQVVNYAINTANTAPTDATAWKTDLTFAGLSANTDYYIFARAIENANYHAGAISAGLSVKTSNSTPIREIQKSDGRTGIRLSKNVVSDKAEFEVVLPNDKVLEVKAVIYDNTGNAVFEKTERGANVSWNLTNAAGRNVANGTYLIIVEAKGINGTYAYSAKVGVKK